MVDYVGNDKPNKKSGSSGRDELDGAGGNDELKGLGDGDILRGKAGDDKLYGGADNDLAEGGIGDDLIDGGAGIDVLLGEAGNDKLYGGAAKDVFIGGPGNDKLWGGKGDDGFAYAETAFGKDTIYGFKAGKGSEDEIGFTTNLFSNFNAVKAATSNVSGSAVINANNTITLEGVLKSKLHSDDFLFTTP